MTKWKVAFALGMGALLLAGSLPLLAGDVADCPCYSIQESKSRGCFVRAVSFSPRVMTWNGKQIAIKESWLEKCTERNRSVNPFAPKYNITSGYNLCFTLSEGWDVLWGTADKSPFFILEGNGRSFGERVRVVLWETIDNIDVPEFHILCTDRWKGEKAIKIKAIPAGEQTPR